MIFYPIPKFFLNDHRQKPNIKIENNTNHPKQLIIPAFTKTGVIAKNANDKIGNQTV